MDSTASIMDADVGETKSNSRQAWVVVLTSGLFFFYVFVILNIFNALNTSLIQEFHISATQLGNLSAFYFYANLLFLFPAGMILDRVSTRRLILTTMLICVVSTFLFANAPNIWVAQACRFAMGVGGAFCMLSSVKLASRWFPANRMATVIGFIVTMAFVGGMCSQLAKVVIDAIGWRQTLFYIACAGSLMTLAIYLVVQDYPDDYRAQDHQHSVEKLPFGQSIKLAMSNFQNWMAGLYTSLLNLPVFVLGAMWGSMYLMQGHGLSTWQASITCSMIFVGTIFGSPAIGWLSDRIGLRKLPMIVFGALSLTVMLLIMYGGDWSFTSFMVLFFLLGFLTSAQIISYPLIAESNDKSITATATGLSSTIIMAGGITQPLVGYLMEMHWDHKMVNHVPIYSLSDYNFALSLLPIAFVIGLVASFLIKETHCTAKESI